MLVLTRRVKEETQIGDDYLMRVTYLNEKTKEVRIEIEHKGQGQPSVLLEPFNCITKVGPCKIKLIDVRGRQARFGFDAPKSINIRRTEVPNDPKRYVTAGGRAQGKTTSKLWLAANEVARCNQFTIQPFKNWKRIEFGNYNLVELEKDAMKLYQLPQESIDAFIDGEVTDCDSVVDEHGLQDLNDFLNDVIEEKFLNFSTS